MKTVFSNHNQCAHVWAAQSQPEGHSGPLYFDGPTIYSYGRHYPIASFQRGVVLFNSTSTTPTTTSKHKPAVWRALNGLGVRVINVPGEFVTGGRPRDCLAAILARREACLERVFRSRVHADMHRENATRAEYDAIAYADAFGLPAPVFPPADEAAIKARLAAQREANRVENARRAAERAEGERIRALNYAQRVALWLAGGNIYLGDHFDAPTLLRLSKDGASVETSRGASVPVEDAQRLWRAIQHARFAGGFIPPRADDVRVGAFSLREIRADGTAVIGCHTLRYEETSAFAKAQGWV